MITCLEVLDTVALQQLKHESADQLGETLLVT